jgi:uncharacterized RDD family membrane protein YckC
MESTILLTNGKRIIAFIFDLVFIMLLSFILFMAFGLIFKIDSVSYQNFIIFPLIILIALYTFFGELFLKNTLGKYLSGIEIISIGSDMGTPIKSYLKRGFLKIIFPFEGLVLMFSRKGKRLGDIWAQTEVKNKQSNSLKPFTRILAGLLTLIVLIILFRIMMGMAVKKSDFYNIGINHLKTNNLGNTTGFVKVVDQSRSKVRFIVPVSNEDKDKYAIIHLVRIGDEWVVSNTEFSKEHIAGFSYGFSF